jgi:hypothetical protein
MTSHFFDDAKTDQRLPDARQFEIPPSKYSFAAWKRALHYLMFFLPEHRFTFSLPSTLAPFDAAWRLALWSWTFW